MHPWQVPVCMHEVLSKIAILLCGETNLKNVPSLLFGPDQHTKTLREETRGQVTPGLNLRSPLNVVR